MRYLTQQDFKALDDHGVQIVAPIPSTQLYRTESFPVFLVEASGGTSANLHFEWLGSGQDAHDSMAHWAKVLKSFGPDSNSEELVQPIIDCVNLGDTLALAVKPFAVLVDELRQQIPAPGALKSIIADLAVVMVRLGHSRISMISLDLDDVLLNANASVLLSSRAEFCWAQLSTRESRKSGIELLISYLLRLEEEIPLLTAQIQEIRGIALAVLDHNGNGGDLGQFILAMRAGAQALSKGTTTMPAQSQDQQSSGKWVRPAVVSRPGRRLRTPIVLTMSVCGLLGILAVVTVTGNFEVPGIKQAEEVVNEQPKSQRTQWSMDPVVVTEGSGMRSVVTEPSPSSMSPNLQQDADAGLVQSTTLEMDVEELLKKRALLFQSVKSERDLEELKTVYVDPRYGYDSLQRTLEALNKLDANVKSPRVAVHSIAELSGKGPGIRVEVEYTLTYQLDIGATSQLQKETERVLFNLDRSSGKLLIVTAEPIA